MTRSGLGLWKGRDLYVLQGFSHVYMHGGEIACLKGLQGAKGYLGDLDALWAQLSPPSANAGSCSR